MTQLRKPLIALAAALAALIAVIVINNREAARHDAVAEQTASGPRA
jgi:hypothetical protein